MRGQRVGLERSELVRASRSARLAQIVNDRKRHPAPPRFHKTRKNNRDNDSFSGIMKSAQPQNSPAVTPEHPGPGPARKGNDLKNSRVVGCAVPATDTRAGPERSRSVTN